MITTTFNLQYLTNEQGAKVAVQIPFEEWNNLLNNYSKLKELFSMKKELKHGFSDLVAVEQGKAKEVTLSEFLDEN